MIFSKSFITESNQTLSFTKGFFFFMLFHFKVVTIFHKNLQYLVDTVYINGPTVTPYFKYHPMIFLFGGGLSSSMLRGMVYFHQ